MRYALLTLSLFLLIVSVSAYGVISPNYTYIETPKIIENGQCVEINKTYDISAIGWGVPSIVYYGRYVDDYSPDNSTPMLNRIEMPNTVGKLSNFYIDPFVFGNSTGYWYQHYGTTFEPAGNLRMFKVNWTCPEENVGVTLNVTETKVNETPLHLPFLPDKHVADLLIARGDDSMPIIEDDAHRWWMFGVTDWVYDQPSRNTSLFIEHTLTENLNYGDYHVVQIAPGRNNLIEERYERHYKSFWGENESEVIISPFRIVEPVDITGITGNPKEVEKRLMAAIKTSYDDRYQVKDVILAQPEIQIMRIDALETPSNNTYMDIRGYTNLINGTPLTVQIDREKITPWNVKLREFNVTVEGNDPGSWRQFNALFELNYTSLFPGQHFITVSSTEGVSQTVGVYVYKELPTHYVPPQYIEYIGASPFITPVTVTVPVPGPTQIVTVEVTPSDEQVHAQQIIAQREVTAEHDAFWIRTIIAGTALVLIGAYVVSVIKRRRERL